MDRIRFPYPPAPRNVPADFTAPTGHYQLRVALVLASLILFFLFYLGLLCGSATLIIVALANLPFPLSLLPAFPLLLLCLFLLKGLFKTGQDERTTMVEITEEDHPRLFAFIEQLCEDTGAPLPYRVFANETVNAAVITEHSILSLFWPPRKNLLIGMGLVNVLNLTEFKAVLAHEFGHFSQKRLGVGSYLYVASRIIGDMVFARDWLDAFILKVRNQDNRVAVFGWAAWGVIWALRKFLSGCFYVITFLRLSLSRQMEFNADLVAVSMAGSDSIVHVLYRADFATEALDQALQELSVAAQHGMFTLDLFHHQNHAAAYLRRVRKDPRLGEPPPLPEDPRYSPDVFEPGDDSGIPPMWADHPPNYEREQNAKNLYFRVAMDQRSAWVLFDDPDLLRERVSRRFYRVAAGLRGDLVLTVAEDVQALIDDEHAETTYDARYHGFYDCRRVDPGKLPELLRVCAEEPWKPEVLHRIHTYLYAGDFKERAEEYAELREEYKLLTGLKSGELELKEDTFTFRGRRRDARDVKRLLRQVERELEESYAWMTRLDRRVFLCYYQMALSLGEEFAEELRSRYEFHIALQVIDRALGDEHDRLEAVFAFLNKQTNTALHPNDFQAVLRAFRQAYAVLDQSLYTADNMPIPALKNLEEGTPLGQFLMDRPLVKKFRPSGRISGKQVGKFLDQLQEVRTKVGRIHFKSLGGILALQERIGKQWTPEAATVLEALPVAEAIPLAPPPAALPLPPEEAGTLEVLAIEREDDPLPELAPDDGPARRPVRRRHQDIDT